MARTRRPSARAPSTSQPPPLDAQAIVAAALCLLDDVGLDGLSMRKLAERLGIRAATLYWYVRDKRELLSLLAEAICTEMQPSDLHRPWRVRLVALMTEYRRVLLGHRDAAQVLAATLPAGRHRLLLVDLTLGAVLDAGFTAAFATRAARLLVDFTTGFVQEEYIAADRQSGAADAEDLADQADPGVHRLPRIGDLEPEAYPHIAALRPYLLDRQEDARFAFGLQVILDGLERHPTRRARARTGSKAARSFVNQTHYP
jgi:TetR/AcrR family tetracycline transcriptional repressor